MATGIGTVAFYIEKSAPKMYIIKNVRTRLNVEDLFDFNYFNAGFARDLGFSQDGASVQASFGMSGVPSGVGECFVIRYETDRTFDGITIQKELP